MHRIFPPKHTYYISLIRNPVSTWVSAFKYFQFESKSLLNIRDRLKPISRFLDNLPSPAEVESLQRKRHLLKLLQNPMFFDFGLEHRQQNDIPLIQRALKVLDDDFQLMLILEHFDESLILLRRRFCWDLDDVVYLITNSRNKKVRQEVLSEEQQMKIKKWNNADTLLYNFFLKKFWKEVQQQGPGFYEEVEELRQLNRYYKNVCTEKEAYVPQYAGRYAWGFKIRPNLTGELLTRCQRILRNEVDYVDYFKRRQNTDMPRKDNFL